MEQDLKRKIIVSEIEHWRRSRLLPEQYCDFLMNLYLDSHEDKPKSFMGISKQAVRSSGGMMWFTIIGIIGLISFVALHLTSFPFWMQTAVSLVGVSTFYMIGAAQREKQPAVAYLCFGIGSVLLLILGLYLLKERGATGVPEVLFVTLCSLVWMLTGIMARMGVFHFSGWMVLFLIYTHVLRQNIRDLDWAGLELSWVPVSIALIWLGWLFHHVNKSVAGVLLSVGLIAWFGSEIYGLAIAHTNSALMQASLIGKLAVAGILLFALRKKWIEWVV